MPNPRPSSIARVDTLVPSFSRTIDIGVVLGGACLTALAAQITIPHVPVPITLQTMSVMLCGLALGARRGALSQLTYLTAGAAGAPVFAGWSGGAFHLYGPTGGYLVGFVVVAGLLGWLAERGWDRSVLNCAAALALGIVVQLTLGTAWLAAFTGWRGAWIAGFAPFVGIEAIKATAVVAVLSMVSQLMRPSGNPLP